MTNHTHLLVTPEHERGISQMMQSLGRSYVGYINRKYERTGTLWEGRYKASLVDSDEYLLCCYRYIELNPVRAGLVDNPSAYRWSSYRHHALGQFDRVVTQHEAYRTLGADAASRERAYRSLVQSGLDDETLEQIRASANADLVLGNEAFKDHIETVLNRSVRHRKSGRPRKTCL
jgi:putative transposase